MYPVYATAGSCQDAVSNRFEPTWACLGYVKRVWADLGRPGNVKPVWANLGRFGPAWADLDRVGPDLDRFGPIWAASGRFGPIWATCGRSGLIRADLGQFVTRQIQANIRPSGADLGQLGPLCFRIGAASGRFGPIWANLGRSGLIWVDLGRLGPICVGCGRPKWPSGGFRSKRPQEAPRAPNAPKPRTETLN